MKGVKNQRSKAFNVTVVLIVFLIFIPSMMFSGDRTDYGFSWKPPLLPFRLLIGKGGIKIEGEASVATPVGTFGLYANHAVYRTKKDDLIVVVRDRKKKKEDIFKISGKKSITYPITDGSAEITISYRKVVIDITDSKATKIEFGKSKREIGNDTYLREDKSKKGKDKYCIFDPRKDYKETRKDAWKK